MKNYSSEKIFKNQQFPLAVELAAQQQSMVPHYHDFTEIVLVTRGSTIHEIHFPDGSMNTYALIRGDLFSVMPGEVHSYHASKQFEIYNLAFKQEIIEQELNELLKQEGCRMLLDHKNRQLYQKIYLEPFKRKHAMECLRRMAVAARADSPVKKLQLKTVFLEFLLTVGDSDIQPWESVDVAALTKFLNSIDYIEQNPTRPVRLGKLAARTGFCDSNYMIKQFRLRQGITPARLRRRLNG